VKLFRRRRALAAGTVPPEEVFSESPDDAPVPPQEPEAEVAEAVDAEPAASSVDDTPITAPVPIVPGPTPERPRRRLRFGFDAGDSANGAADRELVSVGGAATQSAGAGTTGTEGGAPPKVISIGFDDEGLDEIETVSLGADGQTDVARPDVDARLRARRIQVRRDEGRRRLRWAIVAGVVLALLLGAGLVLESPLFAIDDVQVSGAVYTNRGRLQEVIDQLDGSSLIGADLGRAEATLAADPWVRRVRVERRPLRGVRIEIVERVPIATYMGVDQRWRVLDPMGRIVAVLDPPGSKPVDPLELALAEPGPNLEPGATVPPALAGAADVIPRLPPELRSQTCSLAVGEVGQLALTFCDGYVIDLGQPEQLRDKLVSAIYVLNSAPDQVAASSRLNVSDPARPVLIPK
jgi:cell division protein FtsQ